MNKAATPAFAVLVTLVVLFANLAGVVDVPSEGYAGLVLLLLGFGALAWGDEGGA